MNQQLHPFQLDNRTPKISIHAHVERTISLLIFEYILKGDLQEVRLTTPSAYPKRVDYLWEKTCFEAFIGSSGKSDYIELNISPSGDWNIYEFRDYRKPEKPNSFKGSLEKFNLTVKSEDELRISARIDLSRFPQLSQTLKLEVGVAAVIQTVDDVKTYWALNHPGEKPDFHLRKSFIFIL